MVHEVPVIALCTASIQNQDVLESIYAFLREAKERGYYVLLFNANRNIQVKTPKAANEDNCYRVFDLIPYDMVDVVVMMPEAIGNMCAVRELCKAAKAHHCPVMAYDGMIDDIPSVYSYANQAFSDLLSHVFGAHGCKKVDLLTGIRGHYGSECMIDAYKAALERYGIPFDEQRVAYGEYWEDPAVPAVEQLLHYDIPEAMVCVNDAMAIACCSVLRRWGLRVPEDVIVTGSDAIVRERHHTPRLTTCAKDFTQMCETAFDMIELLLDGEPAELSTEIPPILQISESCGCKAIEQRDQNDAIQFLYRCLKIHAFQEANEYGVQNILLERNDVTVVDYLDVIAGHLPEDSCLCLRDNLSIDLRDEDLQQFGDSHELMFSVVVRKREKQFAVIPRTQLIPNLETVFLHGRVVVITTIYQSNEIYGYYAYYGNALREESIKLPKLVHTAGSVVSASLITARLHAINEKLTDARSRDPLTGMLNLSGVIQAIGNRLHVKHGLSQKLTLVAIGLRRLRKINTMYGHFEGDQALLSIAHAIQDCVEPGMIAARVGGDVFLVAMLTEQERKDMSPAFIELLSSRMRSYNDISGKDYAIELVFGKSAAQATAALSVETLIDEAAANMDDAKNGDDAEHSAATHQDANDQLIEQTLNENRLSYHFQPIVSTKQGQIFAYEALMRPANPMLTPMMVIQYAQRTGRLYEIEWLTYSNVLFAMRQMEHIFLKKKVFLNSIPGHFLSDSDFQLLKEQYGDLFSQVVVEFIEQSETDGDQLRQVQTRCTENHMDIAIDDYGTGYSNIANLLRYSPQYVKIDRSLIANIHEEPKKQHFVSNVIEFAHVNGFLALAEGVETYEELRAVIRFGVDLVQGNYVAEPREVPVDTIDCESIAAICKCNAMAEKRLQRKIYMASGEQSLDLLRLANENYTDIFVAQPYLELNGDFHTMVNLSIRVKEDCETHIVLRDAHLTGTQVSPRVILGRHAKLTLECCGDNRMDNGGIYVPDGAQFHLTGRGNLIISSDYYTAYGIGNDGDSSFGSIEIDLAGCLQIMLNGDFCNAIGGGTCKQQSIRICGTKVFLRLTGVSSIGIGATNGDCEITLSGCSVMCEGKVTSIVGIGCQTGRPNIRLNTVDVTVLAAGASLTGIGSQTGGAEIVLMDSAVHTEQTGREITVIGSMDGAPQITLKNTMLNLHCEGNRVLDIGSCERDAEVTLTDADLTLNIRSGNFFHLAAATGKLLRNGGTERMELNV